MDDAEYIFKSEISEKKRISHSAFAKKGGRGSRKCSLPSDNLTKKQLKERNGKLMSIKLNEPTDWKKFKKLSHDLQLEYISNLKNVYEARNIDIANMFGISNKCFSAHIAAHLPELKQNHRGGGTSVMSKKWAAFISREDKAEQPTEACEGDIFSADSLPSEEEKVAHAETSSVKQGKLTVEKAAEMIKRRPNKALTADEAAELIRNYPGQVINLNGCIQLEGNPDEMFEKMRPIFDQRREYHFKLKWYDLEFHDEKEEEYLRDI